MLDVVVNVIKMIIPIYRVIRTNAANRWVELVIVIPQQVDSFAVMDRIPLATVLVMQ